MWANDRTEAVLDLTHLKDWVRKFFQGQDVEACLSSIDWIALLKKLVVSHRLHIKLGAPGRR